MGLLLGLEKVCRACGVAGVRSLRGAVHHPLHRRQHALHGHGPLRHELQLRVLPQDGKLCEWKEGVCVCVGGGCCPALSFSILSPPSLSLLSPTSLVPPSPSIMPPSSPSPLLLYHPIFPFLSSPLLTSNQVCAIPPSPPIHPLPYLSLVSSLHLELMKYLGV